MTEPECALVNEFTKFLQRLKEERAGEESKGVGVTPRGSNDTYPVTPDELRAELTASIWQHLQAKRCPRHFQLALLREAVEEAAKECRTGKECQYGCVNDDNSEEVQFDLLKLQKFAVNCLEKLLMHLTDNAQASNLQNYAEQQSLCIEAEKCQCAGSGKPTFVVGHIKNKRRKMEDRHVCLERFSDLYELKRNYSLYTVFDGHSGSQAASYAASQLPYLLAERLQQLDCVDFAAYREAFESCFLQTDQMFARKRIFSGTTAVCALLAHGTWSTAAAKAPPPPHLFVAWVGDSKALLVSPTVRLQLVKPHKPDAPDERKRIESVTGGSSVVFVQGQWRVNGILNVARSIGDFTLNAVIAEPDFVDVELSAAHDFIILGTDGLWDYVTEATIVQTIYTALADMACQVEDIPKLLIEQAKRTESQDNITVVIVMLKDRANIVQNYIQLNLDNVQEQTF